MAAVQGKEYLLCGMMGVIGYCEDNGTLPKKYLYGQEFHMRINHSAPTRLYGGEPGRAESLLGPSPRINFYI
jgi:hypothetical protein